jgi:hypothetical protein
MQITLLLILSLTLNIVQWIPSLMVENIVNFVIIFLYIISGFMVYEIMHMLYHKKGLVSIWKGGIYTFLLFTYIGFFAMIQIGTFYDKSTYVSSDDFEGKTFYVYKNSDLSYAVSIREPVLPLRSLPFATYQYTPISLEKRDKFVYAIGNKVNEKVYDLKEGKPITHLKN